MSLMRWGSHKQSLSSSWPSLTQWELSFFIVLPHRDFLEICNLPKEIVFRFWLERKSCVNFVCYPQCFVDYLPVPFLVFPISLQLDQPFRGEEVLQKMEGTVSHLQYKNFLFMAFFL